MSAPVAERVTHFDPLEAHAPEVSPNGHQPSSVVHEAEEKTEEWSAIIRQKGKGYIFYSKGKRTENSIGEFEAHLLKNNTSENRTHLIAEAIAYHRSGNKRSNYLIMGNAGGSDDYYLRTYFKMNSSWQVFNYLMWDASADTSIESVLFLPKQESQKFINDVLKNPDLVGEVFQTLHSKLTGDGGIRIRAVQTLGIVNTSDHPISQFRGTDGVVGWSLPLPEISPSRVLSFSRPIGELGVAERAT